MLRNLSLNINGIIFVLVLGMTAFWGVSCSDSPEDDGCWDSYDEYVIEYPDTQELYCPPKVKS